MPETVTCTGCRAPIDVPRDHADATIRCGICWTEVTLVAKPAPAAVRPVAQPRPAKPLPPVAQLLPPKPSRPSAVVPIPKPAAGMAKLEGLIQKAGAKLAGPPTAPAPAVALPVAALKPKAAEPVLPSIQPKPAAAAAPLPVPQAPVPTPVRVPPTHPPVEVQPIAAAPPPVVVPVAAGPVPVVAPIPVEAAPVPVVVPVPAAAPVVVQGEVAETESKPARRRKDDDSRSPYKRRDRDDDDDDDDRPRRREGNAKNGQMIAVILAGIALFVGLCVTGYYLSRPSRPADPAVPQVAANGAQMNAGNGGIPFNLPNPDAAPQPAPGFNPNANINPFPVFPNMPNVPPPAFPRREVKLDWTEYAGDGFKVKVAGSVADRPGETMRLHDDAFYSYRAPAKGIETRGPPAVRMEVLTADVPQGMNPDLPKTVAEFGRVEKVTHCKLAGHDGLEYEDGTGRVTTARLVRVGCRVFVFKFIGWDAFGDKAVIEDAKKTYFDSVSITFDPATPAPVDPNLKPRKNPRVVPNPFPPGFPAMPNPGFPAPPNFGGVPPVGLDSLKLAGRIDPFLAAVMFPDRREAFTVALRPGGRTQGELRRYEYPGFKLKNTYLLPSAGTFAVGSDKTNRLAITTMTRREGVVEGERSHAFGDVQVFDLGPIFADKTAQREELKPLATLAQPANTLLTGLELSPDGGTLYYLGLAKGATVTKPFRVRLSRADAATGKPLGAPLDLPEPAWRTRLSADGAKLYAAEVPLNLAGMPLHTKSTNIVTVDVARWHIERTDLVAAGTAFDLVPTADGVVASVIPIGGNGTTFGLWSIPQPGTATALDVPGQSSLSQGYVARTPDGKRLVTSSYGRFGAPVVEVYDVADWKAGSGFTKVASARVARVNDQPGEPGVPLGHNFELTPDGRYALFCDTGAVVDLTAAGKK